MTLSIHGLDQMALSCILKAVELAQSAHEHTPLAEDGEIAFDLPDPIWSMPDLEAPTCSLPDLSLSHFNAILMGLDLLKWAREDKHFPELLSPDWVGELSRYLKALLDTKLPT